MGGGGVSMAMMNTDVGQVYEMAESSIGKGSNGGEYGDNE